MKKKYVTQILLFALMTLVIFTGCKKDEMEQGNLWLYLTDAPIDMEGLEGVCITFTGISYQVEGESWQSMEDFNGPVIFNLLELTGGEIALMGNFEVPAGHYTGLRFHLDATQWGMGPVNNPGCFLKYENDSIPLFVPSGEQTGYKAVGQFTVPANGSVDITADFDARKSVVKAGMSGLYLLKPTIRITVNNQAGAIEGKILNMPENGSVVVYAYESDTYTEEEAGDPEEGESRFPGAVTSYKAEETGDFILSYLAPGTYDLVVGMFEEDAFVSINKVEKDIEVVSGETTLHDIELNP